MEVTYNVVISEDNYGINIDVAKGPVTRQTDPVTNVESIKFTSMDNKPMTQELAGNKTLKVLPVESEDSVVLVDLLNELYSIDKDKYDELVKLLNTTFGIEIAGGELFSKFKYVLGNPVSLDLITIGGQPIEYSDDILNNIAINLGMLYKETVMPAIKAKIDGLNNTTTDTSTSGTTTTDDTSTDDSTSDDTTTN